LSKKIKLIGSDAFLSARRYRKLERYYKITRNSTHVLHGFVKIQLNNKKLETGPVPARVYC